MGYTSGDVTEEIADGEYAGDRDALEAAADVSTLAFNLAQPWGPFLATPAQSWSAAIDQD